MTGKPGQKKSQVKPRLFIREWRKHRGLTQVQVAEMLDWSNAKVSRLENYDPSMTLEDLTALASILGTDAVALQTRKPTAEDDDIQPIWARMDDKARRQIISIAKTLMDDKH